MEAVRSAEDNPQLLIKKLESFLERFPESSRREQVIGYIYQSALRGNDSQTAIEYGEELMRMRPGDSSLLVSLVGLLDRQEEALGPAKALEYATAFVERGEAELKEAIRSGGGSKDKTSESITVMLSAAYLIRGKLHAGSSRWDLAQADYEKSYADYPSRRAAELMGDLAASRNDLPRALNEYATAFVFPGTDPDPLHREEIRRKLGSCYLALHSSEQGLGDLVLARYDELVRAHAARFPGSRQSQANPDDPFSYVLERPNGSKLPLADYRGKVLVVEFWATWCGPCRMEGQLFEQVAANFRAQPAAAFLAVNVDDDRTAVPPFLKAQQWTTTVAYSEGLDRLLEVQSLPTLVIFDRKGLVVFRQEGLDPSTFSATLDKKVREALSQP
jgi:thiol-disulfide isomerase/thioredoxin